MKAGMRGCWLSAGLLVLLSVSSCVAAEAAFSRDGSTVYLTGDDGIVAARLHPYRETPLDLSPWLDEKDIHAVAMRTTDGMLLVATSDAVWAYDPAKQSAHKLLDKPEDPEGKTSIDDIAFDPSTGGLLVTVLPKYDSKAEFAAWFLAKDAPKLKNVFVRRIERFSGPVFAPNGALFFSTEGDVWRGEIDREDDEDLPERYGVLTAVRYAPLATRETYIGTPCQTGAREIAWGGSKLYAHVARMGGSGWGDIVRMDTPLPSDLSPNGAVTEVLDSRLKIYVRALQSVEVLIDNGSRCRLCSSPDGSRVFYTVYGVPYVVEHNGVPKRLKDEDATSPKPEPGPSKTPPASNPRIPSAAS